LLLLSLSPLRQLLLLLLLLPPPPPLPPSMDLDCFIPCAMELAASPAADRTRLNADE
jgi:hypothetical protein